MFKQLKRDAVTLRDVGFGIVEFFWVLSETFFVKWLRVLLEHCADGALVFGETIVVHLHRIFQIIIYGTILVFVAKFIALVGPIIYEGVNIFWTLLQLLRPVINAIMSAVEIVANGLGSAVSSVTNFITGGHGVSIPSIPDWQLPDKSTTEEFPWLAAIRSLGQSCTFFENPWNMLWLAPRTIANSHLCPIARFAWPSYPLRWFLGWVLWAFIYNPEPVTQPDKNCNEPDDAIICFLFQLGPFLLKFVLPLYIFFIFISCFKEAVVQVLVMAFHTAVILPLVAVLDISKKLHGRSKMSWKQIGIRLGSIPFTLI